jgi:hypothetical protein
VRGQAVTDREAKTIDLDGASCGRKVRVREVVNFMLDSRSRPQHCTEHPRIRADRKSSTLPRQAACEDDKLVGAILFWESARVPVRFPTVTRGRSQI